MNYTMDFTKTWLQKNIDKFLQTFIDYKTFSVTNTFQFVVKSLLHFVDESIAYEIN